MKTGYICHYFVIVEHIGDMIHCTGGMYKKIDLDKPYNKGESIWLFGGKKLVMHKDQWL